MGVVVARAACTPAEISLSGVGSTAGSDGSDHRSLVASGAASCPVVTAIVIPAAKAVTGDISNQVSVFQGRGRSFSALGVACVTLVASIQALVEAGCSNLGRNIPVKLC